MCKTIEKCRVCGNTNLVSLLNLGNQTLTGVFPGNRDESITSGPLELVKCHQTLANSDVCNLVQLKHSFQREEMYGKNYGYRSGLNSSMVRHLTSIVDEINKDLVLEKGDLIIDIGSNDSTLLSQYPAKRYQLLGVDPTGIKFKNYYPNHIDLIPDFFTGKIVENYSKGKKAKVVTSIAMMYDLEDPVSFAREVANILDDNGVWIFEQSYLPLMLSTNSYDTICHEHIEYYSISQIQWILEKAGLQIVDITLNDVNGGSFRVYAAKKGSAITVNQRQIEKLTDQENELGLNELGIYQNFSVNVTKHKEEICRLVNEINSRGEKIFGYGASTKGNVLLQYCGFTEKDIPLIAEVNEDKFGAYTPATHIPIVSEKEARKLNPDYFMVLPWHFRKGIVEKEQEFLNSGGRFIFPLPEIEIVGK